MGEVGWGRRRLASLSRSSRLQQGSPAFGRADHRGNILDQQNSTALRGAELRSVGLVAPFSDVMQLLDVFALFSRGNLDITSQSSSPGRHLPSRSCDSQRVLLEEFPTSPREDELGSPG